MWRDDERERMRRTRSLRQVQQPGRRGGYSHPATGNRPGPPDYRRLRQAPFDLEGRPRPYRRRPVGGDWGQSGPYTQGGWRSAQGGDQDIYEQARERLTQHGQLDARGIQLAVDRAEIILRGTVASAAQSRMAEEALWSIPGVRDINNQLRLPPADRSPRYFMLVEGMPVVGRRGQLIGRVKQVRRHDFLVDRPWARDIYVPFEAIRYTDDEVHLKIRAFELGDQNWERPDLF